MFSEPAVGCALETPRRLNVFEKRLGLILHGFTFGLLMGNALLKASCGLLLATALRRCLPCLVSRCSVPCPIFRLLVESRWCVEKRGNKGNRGNR